MLCAEQALTNARRFDSVSRNTMTSEETTFLVQEMGRWRTLTSIEYVAARCCVRRLNLPAVSGALHSLSGNTLSRAGIADLVTMLRIPGQHDTLKTLTLKTRPLPVYALLGYSAATHVELTAGNTSPH